MALSADGVLTLTGPATATSAGDGASFTATDGQFRTDVFVNSACPEQAAGVYEWRTGGSTLTLTLSRIRARPHRRLRGHLAPGAVTIGGSRGCRRHEDREVHRGALTASVVAATASCTSAPASHKPPPPSSAGTSLYEPITCPADVEVLVVPEHACGYVISNRDASLRIFVVTVEPPEPSEDNPVLITGVDLGVAPGYGGIAPSPNAPRGACTSWICPGPATRSRPWTARGRRAGRRSDRAAR